MFWGTKTHDEQERSFGGYTNDLDVCERYTFSEVRDAHYNHSVYDGEALDELMNAERDGTWIVRIEDLDNLGRKSVVFKY